MFVGFCVALDYFVKFLWDDDAVLQQYQGLLFEEFVGSIIVRLSCLSIIIALFRSQFLNKRLRLVINRPTNNINTITLPRHNKITRIPLKRIPYPSIIILILWYHIRIRKCLKLCLLIPRIVTRSCHMSTCQVVVFVCA